MRYSYLLEDKIIVRNKMDGTALERFDPETKSWVPDWDLSEIYTGDIRFVPIQEGDMWKYLNTQN